METSKSLGTNRKHKLSEKWKEKSIMDFIEAAPLIDGILSEKAGFLAITCKYTVIHASPDALEISGLTKSGLIGSTCFKAFGKEQKCPDCRALESSMWGMRTKGSIKLGTDTYDVEYVPLKLREENLILCTLMENDIYGSKKATASSNEILGKISAGIAHDLATLQSAVFAYLQIMDMYKDRIFNEENETALFLKEEIGTMKQRMDAAADLCKTMSNLSSINREPKVQTTESMINAAISILPRNILRENNKQIEIQMEECMPVECFAVPNDVEMTILNIITNAADHGYLQGGEGNIVIRSYSTENEAVIEIENDGLPIDDNVKGQLIRKPILSEKSNNGIGIHSCATRLEFFGGRLEFESESEKTIFRINLPLEPPKL